MYKIYADNQLLCDSKIEELAIIEPIIKLAANSAGSFTFTLPANHPSKNLIKRRTTILSVYIDEDNEPTFQGIVTGETEDFFGQIKYECEGELTYFNDSIQRQAHYTGLTVRQLLQTYINVHNSQVEASKRFTLGMVTVEDGNSSISCFTNYNTTMTEIKEDLIDDYGGYIRVRYSNGTKYIDYMADSPRTNAQVIKLGENLLDYSSNIDDTDIATSILPLGKALDTQVVEGLDAYTTIKSAAADSYHPAGTDYVYNSAAVANHGWIQRVVKWDDVTIPANLLTKAEAYLNDIQFENVVLKISAIDLAYLSNEVSHFKLLDKIRVVSEFHGMDRYFVLTEQTLNLNNPEKDTIVLGKTERLSLSARSAAANAEIMKRIEQVPTSTAVKSAIDNATALITGSEGGYVVLERNASGQPIEIRIQDVLNSPTKIWRWNRNGLGYSSDGGKTYGLAMTADGAIVADYITAGTMTGDRVRGGTFEIGGTSLGKNGKILVKNAQGQTLITIDKNGIDFSNGEGISYNDISGAPKTIKATTQLFYSASDNTWPARPTSQVTNSDTSLYNTWITKVPDYGHYPDYVRVFTCVQYKYTDDTYGWGAAIEYSFKAGTTKITKDTVTTAYVNALGVTAKYISTKDLVATGVSKIGGFTINTKHIAGYNNNDYANSTVYCELHNWTDEYAGNTTAFGIWKRNNTAENYKIKFGINYDGNVVSASTIDFYPQDTNYGMHVHGAVAIDGKLHMDGGIIEGCGYITASGNIYTGGNVSGSVTDGRSGLNCTGGGLYVAGNAYIEGGLGCGGTKPRIVKTKTYGYRAMNAYETPTPYFGDIGEGVLNEQGECIVYIDDIFAECVNLDVKYQVFLQKYGQGDVWVEDRTSTHFVVKGTPSIRFGWELKAVQLHYEDVRLDTPDDKMLATITEHQAQEGI